MSFSNRLHQFTVGGFLALGLIVLASECSAQANGEPPGQHPHAQQQGTNGSGPSDAVQSTKAGPIAEQQKTGTRPYDPRCSAPKDREDADLCEQRRMSKAAEDAVGWAEFQSKLGVAGFLAVVLSLVFTGWAAVAAGRAAKSAEKSVLVENRPWLKVEPQIISDLIFDDGGSRITCVLAYQNIGGGPAQQMWVVAGEIDFMAENPAIDLDKWIREQLAIYAARPVNSETTFPNEAYGDRKRIRFRKDLSDNHPEVNGKKAFSAVVTFAIFYRAAFDPTIFYTAGAYVLNAKGGPGFGFGRAIPVDGPSFPKDSMQIVLYPGLSRAV